MKEWQTTKQECNKCGYVQVSVHPVTCEYLECAVCHHLNPAPYIEEGDNAMDTRTGLIYDMPEGGLPQLEQQLNAKRGDLVPLSKAPTAECRKCKGTGRVKRGLMSKRWKPCRCCA